LFFPARKGFHSRVEQVVRQGKASKEPRQLGEILLQMGVDPEKKWGLEPFLKIPVTEFGLLGNIGQEGSEAPYRLPTQGNAVNKDFTRLRDGEAQQTF